MTDTGTHTPSARLHARGSLSDSLLHILEGHPDAVEPLTTWHDAVDDALARATDLITDEDIQFTLFVLYTLHTGGLTDPDGIWEWNGDLLAGRARLEAAFERQLRATVPVPDLPRGERAAVAATLFELTQPSPGPSLARFLAKKATLDQAREFLIQRSVYTLREADPHSWAIPRLHGRSKVALVEIQSDEYGAGRADRQHAAIFARTVEGAGLDATYGAYLDDIPAVTFASLNLMSMFGLNRRLRGAIAGHLAAFEMTSSIPNRSYADGFRRLGFGDDVTEYFDEHVEADAVHEQIAAHDLAGALAEDEPALLADILFGASACLMVDELMADHIRESWEAGRSSLRTR
ncbi:iron-containing redox enzyme family protein [Labedella endophytica]|uniref:Iron-containing redox enzyme family protein n=1 Tax=Labedella endophytica TaxID=1523160 RepID=A0A433JVY6_9MICO|nr:iron-containing redox enzyme family protein [Labedella endophytica]RUR03155.1 iron-containing redox enzyme family protein [Labedella endophytica]